MDQSIKRIKDVSDSLVDLIISILENRFFFLFIVVINLYPIISNSFFATLDGASHLYNAKIIDELINNQTSLSNSFFKFNSYIVPNCISHYIILFFLKFMPLWALEKSLLIVYLISLPIAFRYFSSSLNTNKIYSYFVLPFTFSFFFFLGFFNFIIGLSIFFGGLGYFYKNLNKNSFTKYLTLFIFSFLIYLSNPFLLVIWMVSLYILLLYNTIQAYLINKALSYNSNIKHIIFTSISLLPVIILSLHYLLIQAPTVLLRNHFFELIKWIAKIRVLISLNENYEYRFTYYLFFVFIVFGLSIIFNFINKKNRKETFFSFKKSIPIIIISSILLFLYFFLPDQMAQGAYVSSRIILMFFFFIIVFFSFFKVNKYILISTLILMFCIHFKLMDYHTKVMKPLNKCAEEIFECNKIIKDNSTVLCVNKTGNWMQDHLSNYAGFGKGVILSDNYEAYMGNFPILWKENSFKKYKFFLETSNDNLKPSIINLNNFIQSNSDYILIYGVYPLNSSGLESEISKVLEFDYNLEYKSSNGFVKLYKLRKYSN